MVISYFAVEHILHNIINPKKVKPNKDLKERWMWWHTPVIPATQEVEEGRSQV
jgi:hypothetical protein